MNLETFSKFGTCRTARGNCETFPNSVCKAHLGPKFASLIFDAFLLDKQTHNKTAKRNKIKSNLSRLRPPRIADPIESRE